MKRNVTKVVIIGAGAVGSTTAFSLVIKGVAAEVVLVDIHQDKAMGEIWDIRHSMEFQSRNVRVEAGDYSACGNADIVVITAAAPANGEMNRLEMMDKSASIVKDVVGKVMERGFDGIFLVVSNPVDIMTYLVQKISGLPKERVIGTGTILETARLKQIIGDIVDMDLHSIDAYVMGEHGDSMMVPWSHVRAGGKNFMEILADNPEKYGMVSLESIVEETKMAGYEVMKRKGNTQYGIAGAVTGLVGAILRDENKLYPVSCYLEGEYGLRDICCGVPALINRDGIKDIGVFNLKEEELERLRASGAILQSYIHRLKR